LSSIRLFSLRGADGRRGGREKIDVTNGEDDDEKEQVAERRVARAREEHGETRTAASPRESSSS
tara:strand:- start:791 stop:982 length:192 start_codon:yes stop_codon:yes gene_type:complete